MTPSVPELDRCEVRVVVDGAVASTIPIAAADGSGTGDPTAAAVAIEAIAVPNYEQNPRCTEHPGKSTEAEAAGSDIWADDDRLGWLVEARSIDRVCARETFGAHRIYGELACRTTSVNDGAVVEQHNS